MFGFWICVPQVQLKKEDDIYVVYTIYGGTEWHDKGQLFISLECQEKSFTLVDVLSFFPFICTVITGLSAAPQTTLWGGPTGQGSNSVWAMYEIGTLTTKGHLTTQSFYSCKTSNHKKCCFYYHTVQHIISEQRWI